MMERNAALANHDQVRGLTRPVFALAAATMLIGLPVAAQEAQVRTSGGAEVGATPKAPLPGLAADLYGSAAADKAVASPAVPSAAQNAVAAEKGALAQGDIPRSAADRLLGEEPAKQGAVSAGGEQARAGALTMAGMFGLLVAMIVAVAGMLHLRIKDRRKRHDGPRSALPREQARIRPVERAGRPPIAHR